MERAKLNRECDPMEPGLCRKHPNPFTIYLDACGAFDLHVFLNGYNDRVTTETDVRTNLEQLACNVERMHRDLPEIQDFFSLDESMFPLFHFSVVLHRLIELKRATSISGGTDTENDRFLEKAAQFLHVPENLRCRAIGTARKFLRLSRYLESRDPLDRVMDLLSEHPEDTFLLIQFYYLLRIQQMDMDPCIGIGSEEFMERIFSLHENALAELHGAGNYRHM